MKVKFAKSYRDEKKMVAVFHEGGKKVKTVHFGQKNASDFTIHRDVERKQRYLGRHKENEDWGDYMSAGSLSRYILWNKETLSASIADYKKRFKLD